MTDSPLFLRIQLQLLMNLTAHAIGVQSERLWTRSNRQGLKAYAMFTARYLSAGVDQETLLRMNRKAYCMGRWLRRFFLIRSVARAQRFIVALYRNIGIDVSFVDERQLCFHHCYFCKYYSSAVCRAASMLDDGIIRGLLGKPTSQICFTQRLTEGCSCCKASFNETKHKIKIYEESCSNR